MRPLVPTVWQEETHAGESSSEGEVERRAEHGRRVEQVKHPVHRGLPPQPPTPPLQGLVLNRFLPPQVRPSGATKGRSYVAYAQDNRGRGGYIKNLISQSLFLIHIWTEEFRQIMST